MASNRRQGAAPLADCGFRRNSVKALYWSALVNGVLVAPLMAVMMGRLTLPRAMLVVGWLATFVMALGTVGFFSM